jgi:hypothetical protein
MAIKKSNPNRMGSFLKTTASQWTALVTIILVSAAMMYFTFTPYSFFGLQEPFKGLPPTTELVTFRSPDKHRFTTSHNLFRFRA